MTIASAYIIIAYTLFIWLLAHIGYIIQKARQSKYKRKPNIQLSEVTVLIPFRNEEHRIGVLLESIKKLTKQPTFYLFIDDHSIDGGAALIQSQLENIDHQIIHLPEEVSGKKSALKFAINKVKTDYILTWDADIVVAPEYFNHIELLEEADMYILPAVLKAKKFVHYFFEIDVLAANAINTGLAGFARPIFASGANLLYKRNSYQRFNRTDEHISIASGDDTFLMREFQQSGANVRMIADNNFRIETETPQSFKEFFNQRLRWLGKAGALKDTLSNAIASIQAILTLAIFGVIIYFIAVGEFEDALILLVLKSIIDMTLMLPYFSHFKRCISWLMLPFYQLFYPIYIVAIGLGVLLYKPNWKERVLYSKE